MQNKKDVLTTGQVAQICNVAPRTVTKWFDSGQLKGYRIPGSRDRRIPTSELVRFMKVHDMPTDTLEIGKIRILLIDSDSELSHTLPEMLKSKSNYEVCTASNSFDAGLLAQKMLPHVILINLVSQNIDAWQVCKNTRGNEDLLSTKIVVIGENLKDSEVSALLNKGFDGVITDPTDLRSVLATIQEATAIIY